MQRKVYDRLDLRGTKRKEVFPAVRGAFQFTKPRLYWWAWEVLRYAKSFRPGEPGATVGTGCTGRVAGMARTNWK
jgi:hypothetical protein